ncbi:unnamed protein product, partial [Rotaria socialis]
KIWSENGGVDRKVPSRKIIELSNNNRNWFGPPKINILFFRETNLSQTKNGSPETVVWYPSEISNEFDSGNIGVNFLRA